MQHFLLRIVVIIGGIVMAFILYVLPDMVANLGEMTSTIVKAVVGVALLVCGGMFSHQHKSGLSAFMFSAGVALIALLIMGSTIRISELGIL